MNATVLVSFILYFGVILTIGIYAKKFSSLGISEFFIGGRQMRSIVVAISSVVSGRSAWLLLVFTTQSYTLGFSAIWTVIGYIIVEFFLFLYYAPRLRNFTQKHDCITIPDFYSSRFRDEKGFLRLFILIILLIFMIGYVSFQFVEGGKAFYTHFGLNQTTGIILVAVIVLFYTLLGGFLAAGLSDVFWAIVMLLAVVSIPVYTALDLGGFHELQTRIAGFDKEFFNPLALSAGAITGFLGFGLGSSGNPYILVKYMSINDPRQFKWVAVMGTGLSILLAVGAMSIGIMARLYFPNLESLPGKDPANAFLSLVQAVLPPAILGLLLASIFSAIILTADSQLLVTASSLVRDLYEKILNKGKKISQEKLIFLSRIAVVLLVYTAIMFSLYFEKTLSWFVLFAWACLGASIGPTSILALFWKKTTRRGVYAGLITGLLTVTVWKIIPELSSLLYELIPGFFLALIVTMFVSVFTNNARYNDDLKKVTYRKTKNFRSRFEE